MQRINDTGKGSVMEWIKENVPVLAFLFTVTTAIVGWFLRLELRLAATVSKEELKGALKEMYDLLRPMGENIANIKGQLENRHEK